jgi:hypothetical protein
MEISPGMKFTDMFGRTCTATTSPDELGFFGAIDSDGEPMFYVDILVENPEISEIPVL